MIMVYNQAQIRSKVEELINILMDSVENCAFQNGVTTIERVINDLGNLLETCEDPLDQKWISSSIDESRGILDIMKKNEKEAIEKQEKFQGELVEKINGLIQILKLRRQCNIP